MNPITLIFCSWLSIDTFSNGSISQLGRMAFHGERRLHMLHFSVPIFSFLPYSSVVPAQMQVWKEMQELIWVWTCWNQQQNCPWFTRCSSAWFVFQSAWYFFISDPRHHELRSTQLVPASEKWACMTRLALLGSSRKDGIRAHLQSASSMLWPQWCPSSSSCNRARAEGLLCVCDSCSGLKCNVW